MTSPETIFDIWAPESSPWSLWVKPILFSQMTPDFLLANAAAQIPLPGVELPQIPSLTEDLAMVVDTAGVRSVAIGLALARIGYRPIPLFNALPGPVGAMLTFPSGNPLDPAGATASYSIAVVEVWPIVSALVSATAPLSLLQIKPDATPAFLLDSNRRSGVGPLVPNRFDNRAVSFPTDFPSANFLLSKGIRRALLIQETSLQPQPDLAHTLLRWQEAGIRIDALALGTNTGPTPIAIQRPSFFRRLWYRLQLMGGLRPVLGGFGGTIPEESSGSGG